MVLGQRCVTSGSHEPWCHQSSHDERDTQSASLTPKLLGAVEVIVHLGISGLILGRRGTGKSLYLVYRYGIIA